MKTYKLWLKKEIQYVQVIEANSEEEAWDKACEVGYDEIDSSDDDIIGDIEQSTTLLEISDGELTFE